MFLHLSPSGLHIRSRTYRFQTLLRFSPLLVRGEDSRGCNSFAEMPLAVAVDAGVHRYTFRCIRKRSYPFTCTLTLTPSHVFTLTHHQFPTFELTVILTHAVKRGVCITCRRIASFDLPEGVQRHQNHASPPLAQVDADFQDLQSAARHGTYQFGFTGGSGPSLSGVPRIHKLEIALSIPYQQMALIKFLLVFLV